MLVEQTPPAAVPFGLHYRCGLTLDEAVVASSISGDGKLLATAFSSGAIQLWDFDIDSPPIYLQRPNDPATAVALSDDGGMLAVAAFDRIELWNTEHKVMLGEIRESAARMTSMSWSPGGHKLAAAWSGRFLSLWNVARGDVIYDLEFEDATALVAPVWSMDGAHAVISIGLMSALVIENDRLADAIYLVRGLHPTLAQDGKRYRFTVDGHEFGDTYPDDPVPAKGLCVAPGDYPLVAGQEDGTIHRFSLTGRFGSVFEGHSREVRFLSLSGSKRLLVSEARDETFRVWRLKDGATVAVLKHGCSDVQCVGARGTNLIYVDRGSNKLHVWSIDEDALYEATVNDSVRYRNAKVVLVGDSGAGKSGLGLVLTGREWTPTESTHGRHVWTFATDEVDLPDSVREKRETLLWDLAGQPGYRLIHQLHLSEVAVALVVFDARSDVDPLAGVRYWNRALVQASWLKEKEPIRLRKFLVVARCDRGGVAISNERLNELAGELGYEGVFKTSAKEGWDIPSLREAILASIDWESLPWIGSNTLFENLKAFLVGEKEATRLVATGDELFRAFLRDQPDWGNVLDLRAVFDICVGRLGQRGLIRRLRFGGYLLLQPELLDAYASAIVNAARDEPDGLGCIALSEALEGRFAIPSDERLSNCESEELLLIATVDELLGHELALKEVTDDQVFLVFPSQFTRQRPDAPSVRTPSVIFSIDGASMSAYATLAVRLAHSRLFVKQAMWQNVATYAATVGGVCGIALRETEDGDAELTLFFDKGATEATRYQFEQYVSSHLQRRAPSGSVKRRRVFACGSCATEMTEQQVDRRRERGFNSLVCSVCDATVSLLDGEDRLAAAAVAQARGSTAVMNRAADAARDRATAAMVIKGKEATSDFDVFLSHNTLDKHAVRIIADELKDRGVLPWLDERHLRPGTLWQDEIERVIATVNSAAVIVGRNGLSYWFNEERRAFEREAKKREFSIIPVILPDVKGEPELPLHLEGKTWVDLRKPETKPLERLVWGITGKNEPFGDPETGPQPLAAHATRRPRWLSWWKDRTR